MGAYHGFGQDTNTAATTIVQLKQPASALKRIKLNYISVGSDATADNAYEAVIKKTTTAGTGGTAYTPIARDPADGTASGVFRFADSAEPSYTASADHLSIFGHQRSTYQWYAAPGHEIILPVTNDAGVGFLINTVTTGFNQGVSFEWDE